ncbi:MAG: pyridoxine 5'-phosphate synthase [Bacteroidales bacterium]|nr:pyridoxine 5'-phosphate synthase [Bacteroidales bacterium]
MSTTTRLSVNINKVATIRNARGGNNPDVEQVAIDCERFGAQGITVHPRPDERHIRYSDVRLLKPLVKTEFNIEGYPSEDFMKLVLEVRPTQVTLVPDGPQQITSNSGWDVVKYKPFLRNIVAQLKEAGIRSSIFVDTDHENILHAGDCGADRVELYTEPYATMYKINPEAAVAPFVQAAELAAEREIEVNAGHDLSLENLSYFIKNVPNVKEVSIGHALICDALYYGLENTIGMYLDRIKNYN